MKPSTYSHLLSLMATVNLVLMTRMAVEAAKPGVQLGPTLLSGLFAGLAVFLIITAARMGERR